MVGLLRAKDYLQKWVKADKENTHESSLADEEGLVQNSRGHSGSDGSSCDDGLRLPEQRNMDVRRR